MTVLVFSDTHLTVDFDQQKYDYFKKIISFADQVIINGDFWDGYFISFDQFINSRWCQLFPLLKSKNCVYIYGNHDRREWCHQDGVDLFSVKQENIFRYQVDGRRYYIEHGHRIAYDLIERYPWLVRRPFRKYVQLGIRYIGRPFLLLTKDKYRSICKRKIKKWWKKNKKAKQMLICGHSHIAEFCEDINLVNIGFIDRGLGCYLKIKGNQVFLVKERY